MFAVNGSNVADQIVWAQTGIAVTANTSYDFASYISSWTSGSPAELSFSINNVVIGSLSASSITGQWDLFFANWDSGVSTTADIRILNNTLASSGNDFALDDIYFGEAVFSNEVPEPISLVLIGLGLAGIGFSRKSKKL